METDFYIFDAPQYIPPGASREIKMPPGCDPLWEYLVELRKMPPAETFELDAVNTDPKHNKVLFENDRIRIVRVHFGPGEEGPIVDKRSRVVILLRDMVAKVRLADGHVESRQGKAQKIQWSQAGRQATINGRSGPLENIVVELKGADAKGK
jgi:hypothetical protein